MPVICIDAGHGGKDSGAVNEKNNSMEKNIALKIVLEVIGFFKLWNIPDFKIVPTRTTDTYPTLQQRAKQADNNNADLLFSVHLNSSTDSNAQGVELLHWGTNAVFYEWEHNLIRDFCHNFNMINRGLKQRQDLYIIKNTKCHSVILECGFISNDTDLRKVQTNIKNIALTIARNLLLLPMQGPIIKGISKLYDLNIIQSPEFWVKKENQKNNVGQLFENIGNML